MDTLVDVLLTIKPYLALVIEIGLLCGGLAWVIKSIRALRAGRLEASGGRVIERTANAAQFWRKSLFLFIAGALMVAGGIRVDFIRQHAPSAEDAVPGCRAEQ